jgi:hypothetical protein
MTRIWRIALPAVLAHLCGRSAKEGACTWVSFTSCSDPHQTDREGTLIGRGPPFTRGPDGSAWRLRPGQSARTRRLGHLA